MFGIVIFGQDRRIGALTSEGTILDLQAAYAKLFADGRDTASRYAAAAQSIPLGLAKFVSQGDDAIALCNEIVKEATGKEEIKGLEGERVVYRVGEVPLHPPISPSRKIVCLAGNFASHYAKARLLTTDEGKKRITEGMPRGFLKLPDCFIGPYEDVIYPKRTRALDYEVELAAVIGKKCRDVPVSGADSHLFGYTVFLDYSLRDPQEDSGPLTVPLNKNFDTSAVLGPAIIPKEYVPNPRDLHMTLRVNGNPRQIGSTSEMVRWFDELLAWYSRDLTFFPGDMLASGTCSGTAVERERADKDDSWFLRVGDIVEAEVESVGKVRNRIAKQ